MSLEAFRKEAREWLEANCPEDVRGSSRDKMSRERFNEWCRTLGGRGWAAPGWPTEYGGGGLDREHQKVLAEEMRRELAVEIEREREQALERAEEQRKNLELEVE